MRIFALLSCLVVTLLLSSHARAEPSADAPSKGDARMRLPASSRVVCSPSHEALLVGGDLVPYVGTSSSQSGRSALRQVSFNLIGGYAGGLRGAEVAGAFNLERDCVEGFQLAGVFNWAGGRAQGVQIGGALNLALTEARGFQLSGAANVVKGEVSGLQLAGGANVSTGNLRGAQLAGGLNLALSGLSGLQLAPVNVTRGVVHGAQIGVVNVADKSDFSLGVVSINTRGRTQVQAWTAVETGLIAAAVKHGGAHWYGLYGFGARATEADPALVLGLGGDLPFAERFYAGFDVVAYQMLHFRGAKWSSLSQPRAYVGIRLLEELSVFAGASYNVLISERGARDIAPSYAQHAGDSRDPRVDLWPGALLGVRLFPE